MNQENLTKTELKIYDMHCASCEILIEQAWKKIPGVEKVYVHYKTGKADIYTSTTLNIQELQKAIQEHGYTVTQCGEETPTCCDAAPKRKREYLEIGSIFLILAAAYLILKQFDLIPNFGISEQMSYGVVFLIGLVAATSTCIAVTGGLLLAVAGKYNEKYPYLTGFQKFKPHLFFNTGRIIGYTIFGGAIGALGSVLTLSPKMNGIITIVASMVMLILGFQLLKIFPWFKRFTPKMPKFLTHKIHDFTTTENKKGAFLLGTATFFLPCGFTQALQLYILSKGDVLTGALTMFFFSLGTLPALLSLSVISSFAKGAFQKYFVKFAGVSVVMLAVFNINNGLVLAGSNVTLTSIFDARASSTLQTTKNPEVQIVDGKQIVQMTVKGLNYFPSRFTVFQGIPVKWQIDAAEAVGCAQVITVPKFDITKYLNPKSITTINFIPEELGKITFSCTMGMTTRGSSFDVVPNTRGIIAAPEKKEERVPFGSECNPELANCIHSQKLTMEISTERGFYPEVFTVKKGIPVELTIDDQVPLGGCMSVMTIPKYNIAQPLKIGKNTLAFTPTESGVVPITCSMGIQMGQFNVIDS